MNKLPHEIADLCGIVVGATIEDEPRITRSAYGVFPAGEDNIFEVYHWPEGHEKHTTMGFIQKYKAFRGHRYRAASIHGDLGYCTTLKEAVEFIHAHYA